MSEITMGTRCLICDAFIPIISINDAYPRLCKECKNRLIVLLYSKEGE